MFLGKTSKKKTGYLRTLSVKGGWGSNFSPIKNIVEIGTFRGGGRGFMSNVPISSLVFIFTLS